MIGDLRTAALVSRSGSIDWLCLPRFDSPSIFGRLLDWSRGGYFGIAPIGAATATRHYHTGSNLLETNWRQQRKQLSVIDFMPVVEAGAKTRSEGHTSELQSRFDLVCRLLLE